MSESFLAASPSPGSHPPGKHLSAPSAGLRFVGREQQFRELVSALPPGSIALKLVTGEAGIGKSRLVAEVAAEAHQRAHHVVRGMCGEAEGAPALWPWTQIVRSLLGSTHNSDLGALLLDDPTATRFDLFTAVAELIDTAQHNAPLLIILEDLHKADHLSLALLRFLVHQRGSQRVLFIGTFRAREVTNTVAREHLDALSALEPRIDLTELSCDELRMLVAEDGPDARELHAIAGGNPLFIEQVLRLWATTGELRVDRGFVGVITDSSLRAVTKSRIEQLPRASRGVLSALAVHGRATSISDLATLVDESRAELKMSLAPARAAGILLTTSTELGDEDISFAHVLLANAAVELTHPEELRALHYRCAELLADRSGRGVERASHLLQSGVEQTTAAISACHVAGNEAMAALAYEDAISHYRQALRVLDLFAVDDPHQRLRLVIALGNAQWAAGELLDADASFNAAWLSAGSSGDADGVALSALGPGFRFEFSGEQAQERAIRCAAALNAVPTEPSTLRARLLASLAVAQLVGSNNTAGHNTAAKALEMAESLGDNHSRGYALIAMIVTDLDPDTLPARLTRAREVLSIARAHGDRELAANGYFLLLAALLEAGDIRAIDSELDARHTTIDAFADLHDSRHAGWFRCSRALLDGKASLAENLADSSLELATSHQDPDALSVWIAQISIARWMQGRVSEVEPYYRQAHSDEPQQQVWTAVLAWLLATQGRLDEATSALAKVGPIAEIPRDRHWLLTMSTLAEVVSVTGDTAIAYELRDQLISYSSRLVPIGLGIAAWGTVARPLGLLARLLGRNEEALSHFRQSVHVCEQAGAIPWLVESQLDLADALLHGGAAQNSVEVSSLVGRAFTTASEQGLSAFVPRAKNMMSGLGADPPVRENEPPTSTKAKRVKITVMGRFDVAAADGLLAHWTSRKARALLQILVAARGTAVPKEQLMETLWPGEDPSALSNRMSVAISTVRRALDPSRTHPAQHFLRAERNVLQLNRERLDIDAETFLYTAGLALSGPGSDQHRPNQRGADQPGADHDERLSHAIALYSGDVFADEPYEEWARQLRDEAKNTFAALCRRRALTAESQRNPLVAAELHRRVLSVDRYDEFAHRSLITALQQLGVTGQAKRAEDNYHEAMSELAS